MGTCMLSSPVSNSRFRTQVGLVLVLTLACVLALFSHAYSFAANSHTHKSVAGIQLSTDPYKNKNAEHQTEVEPDIFAFGSTIVSTFQAGRFTHGGSDNIGWATSSDNGVKRFSTRDHQNRGPGEPL